MEVVRQIASKIRILIGLFWWTTWCNMFYQEIILCIELWQWVWSWHHRNIWNIQLICYTFLFGLSLIKSGYWIMDFPLFCYLYLYCHSDKCSSQIARQVELTKLFVLSKLKAIIQFEISVHHININQCIYIFKSISR